MTKSAALLGALVFAALLPPTAALAQDGVDQLILVMRGQENPDVADASVCDSYGLPYNLVTGADFSSLSTRKKDASLRTRKPGRRTEKPSRRIGTGVACILLTDLTFQPGGHTVIFGDFYIMDQTIKASRGAPTRRTTCPSRASS